MMHRKMPVSYFYMLTLGRVHQEGSARSLCRRLVFIKMLCQVVCVGLAFKQF